MKDRWKSVESAEPVETRRPKGKPFLAIVSCFEEPNLFFMQFIGVHVIAVCLTFMTLVLLKFEFASGMEKTGW